ncbi:protein PRRC1-B-like isoform X2 [Anthonomus grandis grandis]|uniref:protein PRRC1-B-like isoform X2 n=1 Tax=Anthonomus grandis grandis TaxID=2921223 RepID=UPI0021650A79|nr:protein PRRC1-B-like isoform X2 [Anthonomus grandis grandis]
MDKDDSNGSSFEIVDKKAVEQANNGDKSGTLSTVSSPYSVTSPGSVSLSTGNLLSNVGPPSSLPDFTLWSSSSPSSAADAPKPEVTAVTAAPVLINPFPTTQFSAAIPPNKGVPQEATASQPKATSQPPEAEPVAPNSFLGMFKGALSSQMVTKMVEKAKSSVDSIITTLDPQMNSGGDLEITVASEEEDLVSGVREAAHAVFGKAWVNGIRLGTSVQQSQAIGFDAGLVIAEERIDYSMKFRKTPTVAFENILVKKRKSWFDMSLLVLKDEEHDINVHILSQSIPVPVEKIIGKEVAEIDVEQKLAENLKAIPGWQEEVSGLTKKEIFNFASRVLFKVYKDRLSQL